MKCFKLYYLIDFFFLPNLLYLTVCNYTQHIWSLYLWWIFVFSCLEYMLSCVSSHNNENNTNCYEGSTHYLMKLLGAAMHVFDFISAQNLKVIMTNDKEALQTKNNVGNCPTFGKKQAYQHKHNRTRYQPHWWSGDQLGFFCSHRTRVPCSHWVKHEHLCIPIFRFNIRPSVLHLYLAYTGSCNRTMSPKTAKTLQQNG